MIAGRRKKGKPLEVPQGNDTRVPDPRAIVSRREVQGEIETLMGDRGAQQEKRHAVLALLKETLSAGREEVRRRFDAGADGLTAAHGLSYLADQMLRVLYDHVARDLYPSANPTTGEAISLVALGGYGRGELAPFSDLDLLFLYPYKLMPRTEQVVEEMLYFLWDLGFKVGYAVRSVEDCLRLAKGDQVICTSLLEARWLWGDQKLYL